MYVVTTTEYEDDWKERHGDDYDFEVYETLEDAERDTVNSMLYTMQDYEFKHRKQYPENVQELLPELLPSSDFDYDDFTQECLDLPYADVSEAFHLAVKGEFVSCKWVINIIKESLRECQQPSNTHL